MLTRPVTSDRIHIAILLAIVFLSLLAAELVTRFGVPRISRIESRVEKELRATRALTATVSGRRTVLVIGNSLLNESVDAKALHAMLAPEWELQRFVIESTQYNDWYFFLRSLLGQGARPDTIVLMLSARQLVSEEIAGTYSAYHLFSFADSVRAGRRANLHPTEITGLLAGHLSAYYGLREHVRKFAFQRVIPNAADLAALLVPRSPPSSTNLAFLDQMARDRLRELTSLCQSFGVRCFLILAPHPEGASERDNVVINAGKVPEFGSIAWQVTEYWNKEEFASDGFHMNPDGARRYTARLGPLLLRTLQQAR